jgi:hypothetical protein
LCTSSSPPTASSQLEELELIIIRPHHLRKALTEQSAQRRVHDSVVVDSCAQEYNASFPTPPPTNIRRRLRRQTLVVIPSMLPNMHTPFPRRRKNIFRIFCLNLSPIQVKLKD